jgi:hypothetical protein
MRFDIGDLSREIAACVPIALVKQFGTRHLQCTTCFDDGIIHHDRSQPLALFHAQPICISTGSGL